MKIATYNVNSIRARVERIVGWTTANRPDILCMQELKVEDAEFPQRRFEELGYQTALYGQRTYNGVGIASLLPIADVQRGMPDDGDETQRRFIAATVAGIRIVNVYVPNGQAPGTAKFAYKLGWLARLRTYLATGVLPLDRPGLLLGDFNVAPTDRDVHDPVAWKEQIMCSTVEREALELIRSPGLVDCLRAQHPDLTVFTWWDYRGLAFPKKKGLRIDHIFATPPMAARLVDVVVDREARKGTGPSDHAPVVAEFKDSAYSID